MAVKYDRIGGTYDLTRRPDPRIPLHLIVPFGMTSWRASPPDPNASAGSCLAVRWSRIVPRRDSVRIRADGAPAGHG